jgi:sulfatase modifying factor 1
MLQYVCIACMQKPDLPPYPSDAYQAKLVLRIDDRIINDIKDQIINMDQSTDQSTDELMDQSLVQDQMSSMMEALQINWIDVPMGNFQMGSHTAGEFASPIHLVRIRSPFQIMQTEVTVRQYQLCVQAGVCTVPLSGEEACNWRKQDRTEHPVNCLDFNQARTFAKWVGGDLPSEAQWEYVATALGEHQYPWGDMPTVDCMYAHYSGCAPQSKPVCTTQGISTLGICDLLGNVSEWVLDSFYENYQLGPFNEAPICMDESCDQDSRPKIHRGGSWLSPINEMTATARFSASYDHQYYGIIGFRVVKAMN